LCHPFAVPAVFQTGTVILLGATIVHFLCIALFGELPRWMGWVLVAAYGVFVWLGLPGG
jgi:Ca2+/Na+ antiporter